MARILIVEDEVDIRDVIAFNLRQAGHTVITATRGREALEKLAEKPALVVLDLKHDLQTSKLPG